MATTSPQDRDSIPILSNLGRDERLGLDGPLRRNTASNYDPQD